MTYQFNFGEPEKQQVSKRMTFEELLVSNIDPLNQLVASFIPRGEHPDMNAYLYDPLAAYSANAGKRHRPFICLLACMACKGKVERAYSVAAALEHFHTAALIHDDIADEAFLRRGEPCLHRRIGLGLAINCGDLGLSLVNGTVIKDPLLDSTTKLRLIEELIDMTQRTIEGQALDIGWARTGRYDISEEDYLVMARHKTAYYSGALPLALGAIAANATEDTIRALRSFGMDIGLAFQIQDDLLNLVGSLESTKKDFRVDITEGKRTLITIYALNQGQYRDELIELLESRTSDATKLGRAVEILQSLGAIEYARNYALSLTKEAKERMSKEIPQNSARDYLLEMADWFVDRLQ